MGALCAALYAGGAGGVRYVLFCTLEAMEGIRCVLELLEVVLHALELVCCMLLSMLKAVKGIRCVLELPDATEVTVGKGAKRRKAKESEVLAENKRKRRRMM